MKINSTATWPCWFYKTRICKSLVDSSWKLIFDKCISSTNTFLYQLTCFITILWLIQLIFSSDITQTHLILEVHKYTDESTLCYCSLSKSLSTVMISLAFILIYICYLYSKNVFTQTLNCKRSDFKEYCLNSEFSSI